MDKLLLPVVYFIAGFQIKAILQLFVIICFFMIAQAGLVYGVTKVSALPILAPTVKMYAPIVWYGLVGLVLYLLVVLVKTTHDEGERMVWGD